MHLTELRKSGKDKCMNSKKKLTDFVKVRRVFAKHFMKTEMTKDFCWFRTGSQPCVLRTVFTAWNKAESPLRKADTYTALYRQGTSESSLPFF